MLYTYTCTRMYTQNTHSQHTPTLQIQMHTYVHMHPNTHTHTCMMVYPPVTLYFEQVPLTQSDFTYHTVLQMHAKLTQIHTYIHAFICMHTCVYRLYHTCIRLTIMSINMHYPYSSILIKVQMNYALLNNCISH